jgi:hypothetical protein
MSYILTHWNRVKHSDQFITIPLLCKALDKLTIRQAFAWLMESGYKLEHQEDDYDDGGQTFFNVEGAYVFYLRPQRNFAGHWMCEF